VHVYSAQPLNPLSEDALIRWTVLDHWSMHEAVFLLHGFDRSDLASASDELHCHFRKEKIQVTRAIQIGSIGKEIMQAGQRVYIDTPRNWISWALGKGWPVCAPLRQRFGSTEPDWKARAHHAERTSPDAGGAQKERGSLPVDSDYHKMADEVYRKLRKMGCNPSKNDVAKSLAKRKIHGKLGHPLDWQTIKRHYLRDWKLPRE
jgi:hypothetical protein